MFKIIHPKYLRVVLAAILISASLLVVSCNNESKTETKTVDSTAIKDSIMRANTNMLDDTLGKDTTKGEQTPPPK